jgi:hypothetical protein
MRMLVLAALGAAVFATPVLAQPAPPAAAAAPAPAPKPVSAKGTITAVSAASITIKDSAGVSTTFAVSDKARVLQLKKIDMSAIKPGSFVATANLDQPDGSGLSTELRVFDPALKGLGEGHYDMNDGSGAKMTNGTVTHEVVSTPRGREMDVAYDAKADRGGKGVRHITVPANMTVRSMGPVDLASLKVGWAVEVRGAQAPDGAMTARLILVGENGQPPAL